MVRVTVAEAKAQLSSLLDAVEAGQAVVITRRGKVAVSEAKYHCSRCRRDFFPSDGAIGD